jgi:hypothetical protein
MDRFFSIFGKLVLIIVVLVVIGGAGFYLGRNWQKSETSLMPTPTLQPVEMNIPISPTISNQQNIVTTPPPLPEKKSVEGGVSSGLSFSQYTIMVPGDWLTNRESSNQGTPMDKITISKNGYEISIYQAATGGALCLYPGDPVPEGPSSSFKFYQSISGSDGIIYRRSWGDEVNPAGTKSFTVCQKGTGDYGQPTSFGHISYKTPTSYDDSVLKEMDGMIASLKKH